MYSVLHWIDQQASSCLAGFVHLPYLPQQVAERPNFASMSLEKLVEGVGVCLKVIAEEMKNQVALL
jgi:pyroglutamyl-peptidase